MDEGGRPRRCHLPQQTTMVREVEKPMGDDDFDYWDGSDDALRGAALAVVVWC